MEFGGNNWLQSKWDMARVLCIDDDNVALTLLSGLLESNAHKVLTATNGTDGTRVAKSARADVIICDLMMPGMNGYEFCEEIRKFAMTKKTPVILLTGRRTPLAKRNAVDVGAQYIAKPFNYTELLSLVSELTLK